MPVRLSVYRRQHLPTLRFWTNRWSSHDPIVDTRGYAEGTPAAPLVAVTAGSHVTVLLMRDHLEERAPIFVSTEHVTVPRADQALPSTRAIHLRIDAASGAASGRDPTLGAVRVHLGRSDGPVLAELGVKVFAPLTLRLALHDAGGGAPSSGALSTAAAYLAQAGIRLRYHPRDASRPTTDTVAAFDVAEPDDDRLRALLRSIVNGDAERGVSAFVEDHVNVYFVDRIALRASSGDVSLWGLGMGGPALAGGGPSLSSDFGLERPVMFVASGAISREGLGADADWVLGHAIAHELGHMLGLAHVDGAQATAARGERTDTFSRRNLMHPALPFTPIVAHPTDDTSWRDDVGFARLIPGRMLTLKSLPRRRAGTDDQVARMRDVLHSNAVYRVG